MCSPLVEDKSILLGRCNSSSSRAPRAPPSSVSFLSMFLHDDDREEELCKFLILFTRGIAFKESVLPFQNFRIEPSVPWSTTCITFLKFSNDSFDGNSTDFFCIAE